MAEPLEVSFSLRAHQIVGGPISFEANQETKPSRRFRAGSDFRLGRTAPYELEFTETCIGSVPTDAYGCRPPTWIRTALVPRCSCATERTSPVAYFLMTAFSSPSGRTSTSWLTATDVGVSPWHGAGPASRRLRWEARAWRCACVTGPPTWRTGRCDGASTRRDDRKAGHAKARGTWSTLGVEPGRFVVRYRG